MRLVDLAVTTNQFIAGEKKEVFVYQLVRKGVLIKEERLYKEMQLNSVAFFSYMQAVLGSAQNYQNWDGNGSAFEDGLELYIRNQDNEIVRYFTFTPPTGEKVIFEHSYYYSERGELIADPLNYQGIMYDEHGVDYEPAYRESYTVAVLSYGNVLDECEIGELYNMHHLSIYIAMQELITNALAMGIALRCLEVEVRAEVEGKPGYDVRFRMSHAVSEAFCSAI